MEKLLELCYYPVGTKIYCLKEHSIYWFKVQKIVIVMTASKIHVAYINEQGDEELAENVSDNIGHIIRTLEGRERES